MPRKSEQSVQFIFAQRFLKKKVKVNYLFNVFLRRCLNNWFRLSIFNITAQKRKNNKVNFFAWYFSTIRHSVIQRLDQKAFLQPLWR